jgi:hypothetical protein
MDLPGADSAATMTRNRTLWKDPKDHSKGSVNVTCGTAKYAVRAPFVSVCRAPYAVRRVVSGVWRVV